MKKSNAIKIEKDEDEEELKALLDLIRKQAELDKKLRALLTLTVATTGE